MPARFDHGRLHRHALPCYRASLTALVEMTDGYSGSDLKELCKEAAMEPIRGEMGQDGEGGGFVRRTRLLLCLPSLDNGASFAHVLGKDMFFTLV